MRPVILEAELTQRCRASDNPIDIAGLGTVDEDDGRSRGGGDRGADLEDEEGIVVALGIERESAGDADGRAERIDAGRDSLLAQIFAREIGGCLEAIESGEGGVGVVLGKSCDGVGAVYWA